MRHLVFLILSLSIFSQAKSQCHTGEIFFIDLDCGGMVTEPYVGANLGLAYYDGVGNSFYDLNINGMDYSNIESEEYYSAYNSIEPNLSNLGIDLSTPGLKTVYLYSAVPAGDTTCAQSPGIIDSAQVYLSEYPVYEFSSSCIGQDSLLVEIYYTGVGGRSNEYIYATILDSEYGYWGDISSSYVGGQDSLFSSLITTPIGDSVLMLELWGDCALPYDYHYLDNPCYVTPTCSDGIQNGDEEGVDCGGSSCEPCSGNCIDQTSLDLIVSTSCDDTLNIETYFIYSGGGVFDEYFSFTIYEGAYQIFDSLYLPSSVSVGDTIGTYSHGPLTYGILTTELLDCNTGMFASFENSNSCLSSCHGGEVFFVDAYCGFGMIQEAYVDEDIALSYNDGLGTYNKFYDLNINGIDFYSVTSEDYYSSYGAISFEDLQLDRTPGRKVAYLYSAVEEGADCDSSYTIIDSTEIVLFERPVLDYEIVCDSTGDAYLQITYTGVGGKSYEYADFTIYDSNFGYYDYIYAMYDASIGPQVVSTHYLAVNDSIIHVAIWDNCGFEYEYFEVHNPCYVETTFCSELYGCLPLGQLLPDSFGNFENGNFGNWQVLDCIEPFDSARIQEGFYDNGFFYPTSPKGDDLSGKYYLNGFDGGGPCNIEMYQDITLPLDAHFLAWDQWIAYDLQSFGANIDRFFEVHIQEWGGGQILDTLYQFRAIAQSTQLGSGWSSKAVDISEYAGQNIRIAFCEIIPEYFTGPARLALDNIMILDNIPLLEIEDTYDTYINETVLPYDLYQCVGESAIIIQERYECFVQGYQSYVIQNGEDGQCSANLYVSDINDFCINPVTFCNPLEDLIVQSSITCNDSFSGELSLLIEYVSGGQPSGTFQTSIYDSSGFLNSLHTIQIPQSDSGSSIIGQVPIFGISQESDFTVEYSACNQVFQTDNFTSTCIATCSDGIQNGDEEGVDCGGSSCEPCTAIACDFTGEWENVDPFTRSTTWLNIFQDLDTLYYNPYGSCSPVDCNNGIHATPIIDQDDCMLTFYIDYGFSVIYDTLIMTDIDLVERRSYTIFTDDSGRGDRYNIEYFYRASCSDGIKNGSETGIDCGGDSCMPCPYLNCKITSAQVSDIYCDPIDGYSTATIDITYLQSSDFEYVEVEIYGFGVVGTKTLDSDTLTQLLVTGLPSDNSYYFGNVKIYDTDLEMMCYSYLEVVTPAPCTAEQCSGYLTFTDTMCHNMNNRYYVDQVVNMGFMTNDYYDESVYNITVNGVEYNDVQAGYSGYIHMEDTTYTEYIDTSIIDLGGGMYDTVIVVDTLIDINYYYEYVDKSIVQDVGATFGLDFSQAGTYEFSITSISSHDMSCHPLTDTLISISLLEIYDYPDVDFVHYCNPDGSVTIDLYYAGTGGIPGWYVDGRVYHNGSEIDYIYGNLPSTTDNTETGYFMGSMTYPYLPQGDITIELFNYCNDMFVYDSYSFINDCINESSICEAEIFVYDYCTGFGEFDGFQIYPNDSSLVGLIGQAFASHTGSGSIYASFNAFESQIVNGQAIDLTLGDLIDVSGATTGPQSIYLDYIYDDFTYCMDPNGLIDSMIVEVVPYPEMRVEQLCDTSGNVQLNIIYEGIGGIADQYFTMDIYGADYEYLRSSYHTLYGQSIVSGLESLIGFDFPYELIDHDSFYVEIKVCEEVIYSDHFENSCISTGNPCDLELSFDIYCIANGQYQRDIYYQGGGVPGQIVNYSFGAQLSGANGGGIITLPDTLPEVGTLLQAGQFISQKGGEALYYTVYTCDSQIDQYVFADLCPADYCAAEIVTGYDCYGNTTDEYYIGEQPLFMLTNATGAGPYDVVINGHYYPEVVAGTAYPLAGALPDPVGPGSYGVSIDSIYDIGGVCTFAEEVYETSITVRDFPSFSVRTVCEDDLTTTIQLIYDGGGIASSSFDVELLIGADAQTTAIQLPSSTGAIGAVLYEANQEMDIDQAYDLMISHPCLGPIASFTGTNDCLIGGCTDVNAHNYDPRATTDSGSCETCNDGSRNGDETGVDCGGVLCAPCQLSHDYYVTDVAVSDDSPTAGDAVTLSAILHYDGQSSSTLYPSMGYYLSDDNSLSVDDILLATDGAGLSTNITVSSESATVDIPDDLISGDYYILFVADHQDAFIEADEDNNTSVVSIMITEAPTGDDFYIVDADLSIDQLVAGESTIASCDQAYIGGSEVSLTPRVGFYYSEDAVWDAGDTELGDSGSTLSKNDLDDPESASITIPHDAPEGDAYILFVADHEEVYGETDESNNVVAYPITVEEADLDIWDFWISDADITSGGSSTYVLTGGQEYRFSGYQQYDGDSPSRVWVDMAYYISTDMTPDASDYYIGKDATSVGNGDQGDPERIDAIVPNTIPSGDYYILYVADYIDQYMESDESNNTVAIAVTINTTTMEAPPTIERPMVQALRIDIEAPITIAPISTIDREQQELTVDRLSPNGEEAVDVMIDAILYPNPSAGLIHVELSGVERSGPVEAIIYDALGRQVRELQLQSHETTVIDLTDQSRGTYQLLIQSGEQLINKKFILIQ